MKYFTLEKEKWNKQWEKEIKGRNSEPVKTALEPETQRYSLVFTVNKPDGFTIKLEGSHKVETITKKAVSRDKSNLDIVVISQAEPENAIELRQDSSVIFNGVDHSFHYSDGEINVIEDDVKVFRLFEANQTIFPNDSSDTYFPALIQNHLGLSVLRV